MFASRLALAVSAMILQASAVEPDSRAERVADESGVKVSAFCPEAVDGLYDRGVAPKLVLAVDKLPAVGASASVDVKAFGQAAVSNVVTLALKEGLNDVVLPASSVYGHFTVTARLSVDGRDAGYVQSAYAVVPPEPAKRDPYFMVDKNGIMDPLLDPMRRFGFGSVFMNTPGATRVLAADEAELARIVAGFRKDARTGLAARKDFRVMAAACPRLAPCKAILARAEEGLPPLTADELKKVKRHFSRLSDALSDRVDAWIVQEEFDAPMNGRSSWSTNYLHYLSSWGLLARNICDGLRAGDPKCRIGLLGINCGDYYSSTPPFAFSRRILWPLAGRFDFVALDAYSGNWNRMRNRYTPPEESFAQLLSDAADLSADYGGGRACANVERCAGIDWRAAYDSEQAVDQADYTMRSLIISRTVTNALTYCLHLTSYQAPARAMRAHPDREPPPDLGIWRAVCANGSEWRYVPRPAALAAGTAVRLLSFTSEPNLTHDGDCYVATFAAPGGDAEKALAAVWTTDAAFEGEIRLPCAATRIDAMGNRTPVAAGRWRTRVASTPFFLLAARTDREKLAAALAACKVIRFEAAAGQLPIRVRKGAVPATPTFALAGPGDITPPRAVMPEAGYFPSGTMTFPSATVALAWDDEGISAAVTVKDKEHVQRRKSRDVTGDDCVVFSFYDDSPVSAERPRKASHAVNYVAYLGADGAHGYIWDYDRRIERRDCGTVSAETSGRETVYRVKMPWAEILPGFRPAPGARFAFNLRCPCAASPTDWTAAPYALVLRKQKTPVFQMYCRGFLDSCRHVRLE